MSQLTVIKFYCDDEIRRVPMNRSLGELTYDELCVIVQRIWKSKLSSDINNLVLKYVDDEGDQICLESDNDVNHALSFSSCLKIHIYDKETIPVNSKSLIPNLSLEQKSLESIKNIVKNSRDTLNKIIEQLEKIKLEGSSTKSKNERELKPLSNAELNEFLGDQNDTTKTTTEDTTTTPAVVDQTISSAPITSETNNITNATNPTLDQTGHQGSLVQTPNSIRPTVASQPPVTSTYNQTPNTPQLNQTSNANTLNAQGYASPTTAYQSTQNTSQTNASSVGASGSQSAYQKTNSYSNTITSQPASQTSNQSSNMYASAPPPAYNSSYSTTTPTSQYGSATATSQYGATSTSAPPQTSSTQYPPPSSTASSTAPYQQTSTSSASTYQYPQTPNYGSTGIPGSSVPPPPQSSTYSTQKPYTYGNTPYGQANSTTYGNNPYGAYNNQTQNPYSRPNPYY